MNASPQKTKKGLLSRWSVWFVIACIAIAGISYATINKRMNEDPFNDQPTYEVQQGALTVSIAVSGTIQARNKEIIKSELEGSSTILYLIPEGTKAKKGDLLVELDSSSLVDQRVEQEIKVQNAEAAYINARENLAITESLAKSDIEQAVLTYDFAQQDLKKYKEGEYPKLKKEALNQISQRQEELNLADEKVKWSQILYKEKYISQTELQNDELSSFRITGQLDIAKTDLELLEGYTYKREIAQLQSDVTQSEMALERTKRQANANIVQATAELQAKLSEFEQQKSKLEKMITQIDKAKIYAPMDGLVVYATSVRMSFRGNNEPLEEGQNVRERQELIHLPTTAAYMAEVKVQESSLEKIRLGLPVRITIDAIPGKAFTGKVSTIAPLPNAQSIFMNPDLKVYDTQILIDGNGDDMRSGMGCQAEIIVDHFDDTVFVPVQAILRIGNQPTVFVAKGNEWEPRSIDLGPDNNRLAQIKSGLTKGEVVLLTPPLSAGEVSDEKRFKEATDIKNIIQDSKDNESLNPPAAPARPDTRQGEGGSTMGGQREGKQPGSGRNMTPEQREKMQKRFENMTPEQRKEMQQRFQRGGQGQGGQRQGSGERQPRRGGQE
jgi:HlyD family secretion protein